MSDIINLPPIEDASVSQLEMIDVLKRFIALQDQFNQLTSHVQECYRRIEALHKLLTNERLS
jgi:hypothetical protein